MYWLAITHLEAREALLAMSIADYPQMKKSSRERFARDLKREISRFEDSVESDSPVMTAEEAEMRLRAIIGK